MALAGVRMAYGVFRGSARDLAGAWIRLIGERPAALVLAGAVTAALLHSSSAVEVLALSVAQGGVLRTGQALYVIIGANVGTTMTAQLTALRIPNLSLVAMAVGLLGTIATGHRHAFVAVFSLGAFLTGAEWMGRSLGPEAARLLHGAGEQPGTLVRGFALGWLITAAVQSSTTVTTMLVSMVDAGFLGARLAMAAVLGSNVGTVTTGLVASTFLGRVARRLAVADLLLNLAGAAVALASFEPFHALAMALAPVPAAAVAHAHTLFNLLCATASLPLVPALARWLDRA